MTTRNASYDYLIKLLLIGDSGVGKSCLCKFPFGPLSTSCFCARRVYARGLGRF